MIEHTEECKLTVLNKQHRAMGAMMAPFGGWEMPIQYDGIIAEYRWCRQQAALFDICHMGEFNFTGDIKADGMDNMFTFAVSSIPVGRSKYGFLLNEHGGIIDDLIVFRLADNQIMIVTNAATSKNDYNVIKSRLHGGKLEDISEITAKLDLQGPLARNVLVDFLGSSVAELPYFRFIQHTVTGVPVILSRTGYTGELGYEIFLPVEKAVDLWERLLSDSRVKPAGLGARDLLRLEMGYSLYGSDIDETTTPLEAGLTSFVRYEGQFVGMNALLKQKEHGLQRIKIAFKVSSRRTPRHGFDIYVGETRTGVVTSGCYSPALGQGIGLGYVDPLYAIPGTRIVIRQDRVSMEAEICNLPFYNQGTLHS